MLISRALLILTVAAAALSACGKSDNSGKSTTADTFKLRSECTELGEKLLAGGVHGADTRAEQKSNYNALDTRCYVELDFTSADPAATPYSAMRYLYDGQTKQVLAWARLDRDGSGPERASCSQTVNIGAASSTDCEAISTRITEIMKDER